jgi:hypothetical protein
LSEDWQVDNKNAAVNKGEVAAPQSTNAPDKRSHALGQERMALAFGNMMWWHGKSKNVLAR